ncbi:MAG: hypothetical protein IJY08_00595 [Clostridia bacterium]|nr:hypothetical protein [Clostridia bacterium]
MKNFINALFGGKNAGKPAHKYTAYAILGTSAVLVLAILVLVVSSIAFAVADANTPDTPVNDGGSGDGGNSGGFGTSALGLVSGAYAEGQLYSGDLIVINDSNPLNAGSTNGNDLVNLSKERTEKPSGDSNFRYYYTVYGDSAASATTATQKALDTMIMDYYTANNNDDNLIVSKAYGAGGIYDSGLIVELRYYNGDSRDPISNETHVWVYTNAHKYGFIALSSAGANVFRYVGTAHATYMNEKGIATVEEYNDLLKTKTATSPLNLGNKVYAFYITQNAATVVSNKYSYTVSGNNIDGYIVTVDTNTPLSAA